MSVTAQRVEQALRLALQPDTIDVSDDSAAHAGHAGAREGRHFSVQITSTRFAGLPRLARHRLVYDALASLMTEGIHALAIVARSPDECPPSLIARR
jgi:BolA family transcriptional regulator, general stress-responsive regulator